MTRVERQTMYLATYQALKDQAAEKVPPELVETWLGGAATMCLALAQMDDEVTKITYAVLLAVFQTGAEE